MKKHQKIQIFLFSVGLFLILLTYFYYPSFISKDKSVFDRSVKTEEKSYEEKEKKTTLEYVEYKGLYDFDKKFTVQAENAEIFDDEPDVVEMKKMHVVLYLDDGRVVNIRSNEGKYNKLTYDCWFWDNVIATDGETKILANNLDLLADKNFVSAYNDVFIDYTNGTLSADKLEYNFISKFFNVSMFDNAPVKMKVYR